MDYLNLSCAKDLREKKERILYRSLEILPGFLSFFTLFFALIFSWKKPVWVGIFIIFFDVYWILKLLYLSFHQISAFFKMKKNLKINWLEKVKEIPNWEKVYHLVILPFYKEGPEIIEDSLNSILNSNYPKDKIIVVVAGEERAKENAMKVKERIEKNFSGKFLALFFTLHPSNLEGEIPGKGSNFAFAFKVAKNEISKIGIPFENIIVSNFDVDTKPYPDYFACLTYNFLTQKNSNLASFQPIPIYNNNIWEAPSFSRVVAMSGSFWQMMQQERPEVLVSYSSHSIPFEVLDKVGYPKNVVSDDSRIFWKALLFYNGNYRVIPLFYPVSMDAVLAPNFLKTFLNQYKQQRRWAWGCNDIPFLLFGFIKNKKIPIFKKIWYGFNIIEGFWSWATASLLIAFLGWLPIFLGGPSFNVSLFSYNLPRLTRNLMSFAMFGVFISGALNFLILPKKPKGVSNLKYLSFFFQWLLLPITLIIFGSIPALDAQLRLLLGKYLGFWPTEKVRKIK
jgi:cellulose synthase/poly-beta-1,6-N-acetylglucosamine synthase-like glycosyltransferase